MKALKEFIREKHPHNTDIKRRFNKAVKGQHKFCKHVRAHILNGGGQLQCPDRCRQVVKGGASAKRSPENPKPNLQTLPANVLTRIEDFTAPSKNPTPTRRTWADHLLEKGSGGTLMWTQTKRTDEAKQRERKEAATRAQSQTNPPHEAAASMRLGSRKMYHTLQPRKDLRDLVRYKRGFWSKEMKVYVLPQDIQGLFHVFSDRDRRIDVVNEKLKCLLNDADILDTFDLTVKKQTLYNEAVRASAYYRSEIKRLRLPHNTTTMPMSYYWLDRLQRDVHTWATKNTYPAAIYKQRVAYFKEDLEQSACFFPYGFEFIHSVLDCAPYGPPQAKLEQLLDRDANTIDEKGCYDEVDRFLRNHPIWQIRKLIIPPTLKIIPPMCFAGNTFLEEIIFSPQGRCDIDALAFAFAKKLKKVELKLQPRFAFGPGAFLGCDSLTTIDGLENCSHLSTYCFAYCTKLCKVTLSASAFLGISAFHKCTELEDVVFVNTGLRKEGDKPQQIQAYVFSNCPSLKQVGGPETSFALILNALPSQLKVSYKVFESPCPDSTDQTKPDFGEKWIQECRTRHHTPVYYDILIDTLIDTRMTYRGPNDRIVGIYLTQMTQACKKGPIYLFMGLLLWLYVPTKNVHKEWVLSPKDRPWEDTRVQEWRAEEQQRAEAKAQQQKQARLQAQQVESA